jgi:peptide/nickel transport system ATP-binding protein
MSVVPEPLTEAPDARDAAIEVSGLRVEVRRTGVDIIDDISFSIASGEVLGLVGESGSGKTTAALALLGHERRGARIAAGSVRVGEIDVLELGSDELRRTRGKLVSYVPQDPSSALNPALRIGAQLIEMLEAHGFGESSADRRTRVAEMMREVALPDDPEYLRRYPHQLSGGQQQRVGLAMAFACRPRVIVLDEPTTGLDVTTQAHVLSTVRDLCATHGVAALYVSHDLAVVATLSQRVAVMYAGRVVEQGPARELFESAAHPYTRRLVRAIPDIAGRSALEGIPGRAPSPGKRPHGCFFAPRCELRIEQCEVELPPERPIIGPTHTARCIRAEEVLALPKPAPGTPLPELEVTQSPSISIRGLRAAYGSLTVLHDITLEVAPHECLALVGESGSGKTTLARSVAGLMRRSAGDVLLGGVELSPGVRGRTREQRRAIQYVFQSPYSSLNPRRTIGQIVRRPLDLFESGSGRETERKVAEALERVSLGASYASRYPEELSGGERQRVAIARALVANPQVLICDEVTSALDVSVQAAIVQLLRGLQEEMGLTMLFVTHNLALVRSIAQRVAVMSAGRIVELGVTEHVLGAPEEEYTRRLLADTPSLAPVRV